MDRLFTTRARQSICWAKQQQHKLVSLGMPITAQVDYDSRHRRNGRAEVAGVKPFSVTVELSSIIWSNDWLVARPSRSKRRKGVRSKNKNAQSFDWAFDVKKQHMLIVSKTN